MVVDRIYDGEVTGKLDLSRLCDRSACDTRGRKIGLAPIPGFSTHDDRKRMASRPQSREPDLNTSTMSHGAPSPSAAQGPAQGPSRFFYDQTSYTGVHRFIDHKQPVSVVPQEFVHKQEHLVEHKAVPSDLASRQKELARRQEELIAQQRQLEREQRELVEMQVQFKSTVTLQPKTN